MTTIKEITVISYNDDENYYEGTTLVKGHYLDSENHRYSFDEIRTYDQFINEIGGIEAINEDTIVFYNGKEDYIEEIYEDLKMNVE